MSQLDSIVKSIGIINGELGEITVRLAVLENQIDNILWLQRLILATVVVAVVGSVLSLVLKKRNAKS